MRSIATRTLVLIAGIAALPGCFLYGGHPPPLPPAVCPQVPINNPNRALAMVSVHYHSDHPGLAVAPIEIMPLDEAVHLLRCDESEAADLRRRRAIAKLATAPQLIVSDRIAELVVPADVTAIKALVASLAGLPKPAIEAAVYNYIFAKYGAVRGCYPTYPVTTVTRDDNDTVHAVTSFDVSRSVATLKSVWDPQMWETCSSFFAHSHVQDTTNVPSPTDCSSVKPPQASAPPAPGTSWANNIFEEFTFSMTNSWFQNVLGIQSVLYNFGSGQIYLYSYNLPQSVCSQVGWGGAPQDGGVEVDDGYSYIWPAGLPSWTSTITTKNVRFSGRPPSGLLPAISKTLMNDYAQVLLAAMGGETTTMACCKRKRRATSDH
jgi:hypothetical protein